MSRRIYRVIMIATALALVAFGIPLAVVVRKLNQNEAVVRLEREAARASLDVRSAEVFERRTPPWSTTSKTHSFGVYDTAGRLRLGRGPDIGDLVVQRALRGDPTSGTVDGQLVVALPISNDDRVFAVMRAGMPESEVREDVVRTWALMAFLATAIVVVAASVGRWEARRLSKPVEELAVAVTRLGDGNFTQHTTRSGVPEIDQAATALDATADRLGRLVSRERAFTSDASHQLRTPLTGLRLQLENALLLPPAEREGPVLDALAAAERLETTIADLLALARDTGPERDAIDVAALVVAEAPAWRRAAERVGRPLHTRTAEPLPPVRVSPAAIRQILDVLVTNALEHGDGVVTVEVAETPGGVTVDVVDQGPGVAGDPEEVFRRGAPASDVEPTPHARNGNGNGSRDRTGQRRQERHGIGLPLARSLAEAEGGRLVLRHSGPGPRFTLLLPAAEDRAHEGHV